MRAQNDIIKLITSACTGKDADGFPIDEILEEIEVFASVQSVKRTEYYAALRDGIIASKVVIINSDDYDSCVVRRDDKKYTPNFVEIESDRYMIVRMYQTDDYTLELTLQEVE